jgi:uncharacterized protein YjaZ
MQFDVLDSLSAMAAILAADPAERPGLVRRLWQPMRGMYRFAPGMDMVDAHRGSFGFPLTGPGQELQEGLDLLADADAWARIATALNDAGRLLSPGYPLPDRVQVLLVLGDPGDEHFLREIQGLSALGGFSGYITLTLWPTPVVLERLEAIAVHELHHNVRYSPGGVVWNPATVTVGEQVVAEGLADAFARDLYGPLGPTHFAHPLVGDRAVLEKVARGLDITGMRNFTPWIHGDASARRFGVTPVGLPTGAGYAAGLDLVNAYLDQTGQTAADAVATPAVEVLRVALPLLGLDR